MEEVTYGDLQDPEPRWGLKGGVQGNVLGEWGKIRNEVRTLAIFVIVCL